MVPLPATDLYCKRRVVQWFGMAALPAKGRTLCSAVDPASTPIFVLLWRLDRTDLLMATDGELWLPLTCNQLCSERPRPGSILWAGDAFAVAEWLDWPGFMRVMPTWVGKVIPPGRKAVQRRIRHWLKKKGS
jgi:hypothetical protein